MHRKKADCQERPQPRKSSRSLSNRWVSKPTIFGRYQRCWQSVKSELILSSFLPQDKVAEFAKMAPITVLRETMRAAGDPRLSKWHETLIEKGAKLRKISAVCVSQLTTLVTGAHAQDLENDLQKQDNLQNDVARIEPDVEHYLQRAQQEREVRADRPFSPKCLYVARNPRAACSLCRTCSGSHGKERGESSHEGSTERCKGRHDSSPTPQ